MFSINEKKLNRQKEIVRKWIKAGYRGIIQCVTGFGKTFIAMLCLNYIFQKKPNTSVIIVVPTLYLQGQWLEKLKEFKLDKYDIKVLVINTASKSDIECDVLIVDEVHVSCAEQFFNVYSCIKYKSFIGLTATLERSDGRHKLLLDLFKVVDIVTVEEALREGYVSDFLIYNIPVELTKEETENYNKIQKSYLYYEYLLGGNFKAWINGNYYLSKAYKEQTLDDEDTIKANIKNSLMYRTMVNRRKTILHNAHNKIKLCVDILDLFPDRKAIVFSESQAFAEELDKAIGKQSAIYHSGLKTKEKKLAIAKFIDGRTSCRILTSVKALDAGVDISGVNLGIAAAGSSKQLQDIQRRGRSTRINKDNTIAYYFNLYIKETQEEKWIKTKCYNVPNVVWINDLKDLNI